MPEKIESEKKETSPEVVADEAVSAIELRDKSEPSSEWGNKVKEFLTPKNFGADTKTAAFFGLGIIKNMVRGIYEFASVAIKKKGKIGFMDGYSIGKKLFDFDESEKGKK